MVFYIPFILLTNFIFLKNKEYKFNLLFNSIIFLFSYLIFIIFYFNFNNGPYIYLEICESLKEFLSYKRCIDLNGISKISESKDLAFLQFLSLLDLSKILQTLFFIFLGFLPLFIFFKFQNVKIINKNISIKVLLFICILFTVPIYMTIDWGRWTYINYICSLIIFLHLSNTKSIEINNNLISKKILGFNSILKFLITTAFCFSWNLKILNIDDRGSLPLLRATSKSLKFIFSHFF